MRFLPLFLDSHHLLSSDSSQIRPYVICPPTSLSPLLFYSKHMSVCAVLFTLLAHSHLRNFAHAALFTWNPFPQRTP